MFIKPLTPQCFISEIGCVPNFLTATVFARYFQQQRVVSSGTEGAGGHLPPQILEDQFTLCQTKFILAPLIFRPSAGSGAVSGRPLLSKIEMQNCRQCSMCVSYLIEPIQDLNLRLGIQTKVQFWPMIKLFYISFTKIAKNNSIFFWYSRSLQQLRKR